LGGVTGDGVDEALAIDNERLAATGGLALAKQEYQVRVVVPEWQVAVDP
jgi:hypothetical protein